MKGEKPTRNVVADGPELTAGALGPAEIRSIIQESLRAAEEHRDQALDDVVTWAKSLPGVERRHFALTELARKLPPKYALEALKDTNDLEGLLELTYSVLAPVKNTWRWYEIAATPEVSAIIDATIEQVRKSETHHGALDLVRVLPPRQALSIIREFIDERSKVATLASLINLLEVRHQRAQIMFEAFELAKEIQKSSEFPNAPEHHRLQAELARDLPLTEAINEVRSVQDNRRSLAAMARFAPQLPAEIRTQSADIARATRDELQQVDRLIQFAAYFTPEQLKHVFDIVDKIDDEKAREKAIETLSSYRSKLDNSRPKEYVADHKSELRAADLQDLPGDIGGQNAGFVSDAVPPEEHLKRYLAAIGIAEERQSSFVTKIEEVVAQSAKPKWDDRERYDELRHLSAPRFLRAVYPEAIDTDGNLTNEELVRRSDPQLVRVVQGYIAQRKKRDLGLADAKGLVFAKKDNRGGARKPKAKRKRRTPVARL